MNVPSSKIQKFGAAKRHWIHTPAQINEVCHRLFNGGSGVLFGQHVKLTFQYCNGNHWMVFAVQNCVVAKRKGQSNCFMGPVMNFASGSKCAQPMVHASHDELPWFMPNQQWIEACNGQCDPISTAAVASNAKQQGQITPWRKQRPQTVFHAMQCSHVCL